MCWCMAPPRKGHICNVQHIGICKTLSWLLQNENHYKWLRSDGVRKGIGKGGSLNYDLTLSWCKNHETTTTIKIREKGFNYLHNDPLTFITIIDLIYIDCIIKEPSILITITIKYANYHAPRKKSSQWRTLIMADKLKISSASQNA